MWAVRTVHDRPFRAWGATAIAFVAAMLGFSLLTAQAEATLGVVRWLQADAADRGAVGAQAVSVVVRPLVAWGIGTAVLLGGIALGGPNPAGAAGAPRVGWRRWVERLALGGMAVGALLGVWVWWALRRQLVAALGAQTTELAVTGLPKMQVQVAIGAVASLVLVGGALAIAGTQLRERRTPSAS